MKIKNCPFCGFMVTEPFCHYSKIDELYHGVIGCENKDCVFMPQVSFKSQDKDSLIKFLIERWNTRKK